MSQRRTKILATLGPASSSPATLAALVAAGADAFRLNFSHGTHEEHAARVGAIRALEERVGRPLAILQDLQGPKIRTTEFPEGGVELSDGATFRLTADSSLGSEQRCGLTLPLLLTEVEPGQRLLLRDGLLELAVVAVHPGELVCRVVHGGHLGSHSGINVPDADLSVPALSDKDRDDLVFGAQLGVDWVALSFVRTAEDLRQARAALAAAGSGARLMAKIEKPGAVSRFEAILAASDGIMLARGDLGVEVPDQDVPVIQKRLLARAIEAAKPVVVATQMLESMVLQPRPTRAETSDVATAIFDLADAVMLSGETAAGKYPVEAVKTMCAIAQTVEASPEYRQRLYRYYQQSEPSIGAAVAHSACRMAEVLPAAAIASYTCTGTTARRVARHRPHCRIAAFTPSAAVARQLVLGWALEPAVAQPDADSERMLASAVTALRADGRVQAGQAVVMTAGMPFGEPGHTNLLRVERV